MRRTTRLFTILFGFYVALIGLLVVRQEAILFVPSAEGTRTPRDFGVAFDPITVTAKDNHQLNGWFVHQKDSPDTGPVQQQEVLQQAHLQRAILVYCHGNGGNLSSRAHVTALFASLGLDTVMVAAPGYGMSGFGVLSPSEEGFYAAAHAAYQFARARVTPDRILVWGHSMGAAAAAHLAANNPVAGLVLESPFSSVAAMVPERYPGVFVPSALIRHHFPTIDFVRSFRGPLLVMSAQQDTIIPPRMGREVFEAAHEPKTFLPLSGIDHNDLPERFERFREPIGEFVRSSLAVVKPGA